MEPDGRPPPASQTSPGRLLQTPMTCYHAPLYPPIETECSRVKWGLHSRGALALESIPIYTDARATLSCLLKPLRHQTRGVGGPAPPQGQVPTPPLFQDSPEYADLQHNLIIVNTISFCNSHRFRHHFSPGTTVSSTSRHTRKTLKYLRVRVND